MKNHLLHIITFLFLCSGAFAQAGIWTWMNGDNFISSMGNFGLQGVPSILNTPPALYEPCSWKDTQGNFWVYGGFHGPSGNPNDTLIGDLNDLWKFNPYSNIWTWIKGDANPNNFVGNSGLQGVPSPSNQPGCRAWGTPCWTDLQGNFWMYGGDLGSDDLWKYDVLTNEWTWMSGNVVLGPTILPPVYGIKGVPAITNTPGTRIEVAATWVDSYGNLWIFGGGTYDINNIVKNDLWKYDISTNLWTWMSGDSVVNLTGNYGIKNSFSATNIPSSRSCYSSWKDSTGKFYFFGGILNDYFSSTCPYKGYNDVWCYDPQINMWAWVGGTSNYNNTGYNAGLCIENPNNIPWNAWENRATSTDKSGNVFMFGGIAAACSTYTHENNELWVYKQCTGNWKLLKTGNINGTYGIKGIPNISNSPHAKSGSVSWIDSLGNFWLFGGTYNGNVNNFNDMWRFTSDTNCILCLGSLNPPSISIASTDTSFCEKQCINFFDLSTNNPTSWQWFFPGADSLTSTLQNPTNICYNSYGSFDVTLIACNAAGCDTLHLTNFITCYQNPTDSIYQSNDTLFSLPAFSYQWYEVTNGIIAGATNQYFIPQQAGSYYCVVTDSIGCAGSSGIIVITGIAPLSLGEGLGVRCVPNPNDGSFDIDCAALKNKNTVITISDETGRIVFHSTMSFDAAGKIKLHLNFTKGVYFIHAKTNDLSFVKMFVVIEN